MRDHGTPEMGSWSYQAREARKRAAQRKKRHLRNAVTYGEQGKWHRATVEVDKARLAHDGDSDRFYNALIGCSLAPRGLGAALQRKKKFSCFSLFFV